jgi:hypothetical protein
MMYSDCSANHRPGHILLHTTQRHEKHTHRSSANVKLMSERASIPSKAKDGRSWVWHGGVELPVRGQESLGGKRVRVRVYSRVVQYGPTCPIKYRKK